MIPSDPARRPCRGVTGGSEFRPPAPVFPTRTLRLALRILSKRSKWMAAAALVFAALPALRAQTVEDGIMIPKRDICAGALYTHDAWNHYWEGTLNRTNGNMGTVKTQTLNYMVNYGAWNRLNVFGMVPYVWTYATQGVLHGQEGFQDLSLAAKYELIRYPVKEFGTLRFFTVLSASTPMTHYEPDFQPMSIGLHSKTIAPRATLNFEGFHGLYVNGSASYVFRGNVTLDRNYYYTNGQLYLSNQVAMPNQFTYVTSAGYHKHDLLLVGNFEQQQTRGGGDIRPQDLPFVSNRMNHSNAGFSAVAPIPFFSMFRGLEYWFTYSNTFDGRNVGQSTTYTYGLMYRTHPHWRHTK